MSRGAEPMRPNGQMGTGEAVGQMATGLGRLLADHLTLAKLELTDGLKRTGGDVGKIAAAVPLLIIGYCFLCSGLAVVLTQWLGVAGGLFAVGGGHILIGLVIAGVAALRLKRRKWLAGTMEELNHTVAVLKEPERLPELPHGD